MQSQNKKPFTTEDTEEIGTSGHRDIRSSEKDSPNAEEREREGVRQRAEALVRRIGETCDELERLAEENPELVARVTRGAEEHKDAYVRLKARLELANATPRCRWLRRTGRVASLRR